MKSLRILLPILLVAVGLSSSAQSFNVSFPKERSTKPLDGRMLLLLSSDPSAEPRMQINDTPATQMIFGTNVDGLALAPQ